MNRNLVLRNSADTSRSDDHGPQEWDGLSGPDFGDEDYDEDEPLHESGFHRDGESSFDGGDPLDAVGAADVGDIRDIDEQNRITSLDEGRHRPLLRLLLALGVVVAALAATVQLFTEDDQQAETGPGPDQQQIVDSNPPEESTEETAESTEETAVVEVTVPPGPTDEPPEDDAATTPDNPEASTDSADVGTPVPAPDTPPAEGRGVQGEDSPDSAPAPGGPNGVGDGDTPAPSETGADTGTGTPPNPVTGGPRPAAAGTPDVFRYYGNPQIALSLADTEAGGRAIDAVSLRVRFPRSGTLTDVRTFIIYRAGEQGSDSFYHKGDGGTVEFRLEADDGSPGHHASGRVLARTGNVIGGPEIYRGSGPADAVVGGEPGDDGNFRNFEFLQPVQVEANTWYHLVMYNTGNDARNNFVSYDNLNAGERGRAGGAVPLFGNLDYGVSYRVGDSWTDRDQQWAIADFTFNDGYTHGNGYMEVGRVNGPDRASQFVRPDQAVRQSFTPTQDLVVTGAHVGAMHVNGNNSLTLRLTDGSGTELWKGTASGFPTGQNSGAGTLVTAQFRGVDSVPKLTLRAGRQYFLEVLSSGGTHTVSGLRDGSVKYSFSSGSTVDGHAELRSGGGSWVGWPLGHAPSARNEFDISFYLVTENCVGCR